MAQTFHHVSSTFYVISSCWHTAEQELPAPSKLTGSSQTCTIMRFVVHKLKLQNTSSWSFNKVKHSAGCRLCFHTDLLTKLFCYTTCARQAHHYCSHISTFPTRNVSAVPMCFSLRPSPAGSKSCSSLSDFSFALKGKCKSQTRRSHETSLKWLYNRITVIIWYIQVTKWL